jgi:hypothetical protein
LARSTRCGAIRRLLARVDRKALMILLLLLMSCALTAHPTGIERCTCVPGPGLTTIGQVTPYVTSGRGVFSGQALSQRIFFDSVVGTNSAGQRRVGRIPVLETVVARRSWWGRAVADTIVVRTPAQTESCGAKLHIGVTYVFVGLPDSTGHLEVSKCLAPRPLQGASELIRLLRATGTARSDSM